MKKNLTLGATLALVATPMVMQGQTKRPNVIVILADDMGYGDMSAYGATAVQTPNLDKLANEGVRFTNGYATSATSTPSRYAMMTGMYPWKNKNARILPGDAPLLIKTNQYTLPKMMQEAGYYTGAIGKWHLGMGNGNVNWNETVKPGAKEIGFDYSCLIAATNDRVPTVYVQNGDVVGLDKNDPIEVSYKKNFPGVPTAITNPELMTTVKWAHGHNNTVVNGIPRIGYMKGGKSALWVDEDMADYFVGEVGNFIDQHGDKPFFLYYGLHQPHVPRAPHSRFVGATTMGPRGDAIVEADWCVGQLIKKLEAEGLLENTIIFYSSDNGPVLNDGYKDGAPELLGDHKPAGVLRGGKYSLFDAGTHVPFMAYWKGTIKPKVSNALVCQFDIMPSLAELLDLDIPEMDGEDVMDAFLGKSNKGREELVVEANGKLAFRSGDWALIPPYKGKTHNETGNEIGNLPTYGFYNLKKDPSQKTNLNETEKRKLTSLWEDFLDITEGFYKSDVAEIKLQ